MLCSQHPCVMDFCTAPCLCVQEVVMFNDGAAVLGSSSGHHMPRWEEMEQRLGEAVQSHNMPVRPLMS